MQFSRIGGWLTAALAVTCGAIVAAQQPAPRFDVVSIKLLPDDTPPVMREAGWTPVQPGGRYVTSVTNIVSLITFAYGVKQPDTRLLGLPDWKSTKYALSAKAADDVASYSPADNIERVRLMMRALLADRFHLQLHTETRQETILRISVEKGGLRLKEVPAPVPPLQEGRVGLAMGDDGGRMIGTKVTVAAIGRAAGTLLRQDVTDDTGLTGYYDVDLRWSAPPDPNSPPPSAQLGPGGMVLFMSTLKDQLGLRFTREPGPVQYWIVDHIERPTAD